VLASRPDPSPEFLTRTRYSVATSLEDAVDVAQTDPEVCTAILFKAVEGAVQYRFWEARQWQPRHKDTLRALEHLDAGLAEDVRAFYQAVDREERLRLARRIVRQTVQETGFFEWESQVETT
jgi:hypothetical protein